MVQTPGVLARRERLLTPTGELTDGAAIALQVGKVDQALRIYRDLERVEDENPTWSLRVAECYRRLSQRDGELSALMRAASRYEQRGFVREALALWKRVQMVDPSHQSARVAVERLEPSRGLGLERFRSSFPPGVQHPVSHIAPLGAKADSLSVPPTIPAPAPVPAIDDAEELDVPVVDAGLEATPTGSREVVEELDVPVGDAAIEAPAAGPATSTIAALKQIEATIVPPEAEPPATQASVAMGDAFETDADSPVFVLVPRKRAAEDVVPVTLRANEYEDAAAAEASRVVADAGVASSWSAAEGAPAEPDPEPCSVVMTPVVPVVADLPAMPPIPPAPRAAAIAPLPIIDVGAEPEAEVEFMDAEVLPCIQEIDQDW